MSLELVLNEKTIKSREKILTNYLKNNDIGALPENEIIYFKHIFEQLYTPDDIYSKFHTSVIKNVHIIKDNFGNKCFSINVDNSWYPTSKMRLAGRNRSENTIIRRALRNAIEEQISNYRLSNPLNSINICPIMNTALGFNAEVDHQIPFYILAEEWLSINKSPTYIYDLDKFNYVLQEPYLQSWVDFHLEKAILRWVSKDGNKIAHKLYTK